MACGASQSTWEGWNQSRVSIFSVSYIKTLKLYVKVKLSATHSETPHSTWQSLRGPAEKNGRNSPNTGVPSWGLSYSRTEAGGAA